MQCRYTDSVTPGTGTGFRQRTWLYRADEGQLLLCGDKPDAGDGWCMDAHALNKWHWKVQET